MVGFEPTIHPPEYADHESRHMFTHLQAMWSFGTSLRTALPNELSFRLAEARGVDPQANKRSHCFQDRPQSRLGLASIRLSTQISSISTLFCVVNYIFENTYSF